MMEEKLQEQADKIQRYERKLRDIVTVYKKLQSENESMSSRLQSADLTEAHLREELKNKSQAIEDQRSKLKDLNEKLKDLVCEKDKLRREVEKIPILTERIDKLSKDLDVEQNNSKSLKSALAEALEQHELSTQHFEMRISEIVSTLKTYQEIHKSDSETINQLRSDKGPDQGRDGSQVPLNKTRLAEYISTLVSRRSDDDDDAEGSNFGDLYDLMSKVWCAIVEVSSLSRSDVEKQLIQRLGLKAFVPIELLEVSEKEKTELQYQVELMKLQPLSPRDLGGARTSPARPSSAAEVSDEKRKLEEKLTEAQEHVKLLRQQNLTTLLELESVKKAMRSKIAAVESEASRREAETAVRHEAQILGLETEARRYREQTLSLLTEKDEEISELRTALLLSSTSASSATLSASLCGGTPPVCRTSSATTEPGEATEEPDSSTGTVLQELNDTPSHCGLVHCAERHGRMVIELKKLCTNKRELEQRVEALEKELREERKAALQAARNACSETPATTVAVAVATADVNVAYVKNIVFNLLSNFKSSSLASRIAVVKALAMALKFSSDEENALIEGLVG